MKDDMREDIKGTEVKDNQDPWFKKYWRPAMAIQYIIVCLFDFIIAPSLVFLYLDKNIGLAFVQWEPITLSNSGFYHLAMGAVLGIYTWSRGQEKIKGVD